jgi:hypothetical protein
MPELGTLEERRSGKTHTGKRRVTAQMGISIDTCLNLIK